MHRIGLITRAQQADRQPDMIRQQAQDQSHMMIPVDTASDTELVDDEAWHLLVDCARRRA